MARKLRVSVNAPARPGESELRPSAYVTQYHWPRIIAAALFLLLLLTALYLWIGDSEEVMKSDLKEAPLFADSPSLPSPGEQPELVPESAPEPEPEPEPEPAPESAQPSKTADATPSGSRALVTDSLGLSTGSLASSLSDEVDASDSPGAAGVMSPEFDARQSRFRLSVNDEPAKDDSNAVAATSESDPEKDPAQEYGVMNTFSPAVTRAMLTSEIIDSEPGEALSGAVQLASGEVSSAHVFAQIEDLEGAALRIIWYRDNVTYATMPLTVHSARAVLTARLGLQDTMAGEWRVELQDDGGQLLSSGSFIAGT